MSRTLPTRPPARRRILRAVRTSASRRRMSACRVFVAHVRDRQVERVLAVRRQRDARSPPAASSSAMHSNVWMRSRRHGRRPAKAGRAQRAHHLARRHAHVLDDAQRGAVGRAHRFVQIGDADLLVVDALGVGAKREHVADHRVAVAHQVAPERPRRVTRRPGPTQHQRRRADGAARQHVGARRSVSRRPPSAIDDGLERHDASVALDEAGGQHARDDRQVVRDPPSRARSA